MCYIYLRLCHIVIAISRAHSFWQFSLIFFVIKIRQQVKNHTNRQPIFNFCKIPVKYQNSVALLKILRSSENCGPYSYIHANVS